MLCRLIIVGWLAWCVLGGVRGQSQALASTEALDIQTIFHGSGEEIGAVASDVQAIQFFSTRLAPALDHQDLPAARSRLESRLGGASSDSFASRQGREIDVKLVKALARSRLAGALKHAADAGDTSEIGTWLEHTRSQREWLAQGTDDDRLHRAITLATVLAAFGPADAMPSDLFSRYELYAAALDRAYPRLAGSPDSWLAVAESKGVDAIRQRLSAFRENEAVNSGGDGSGTHTHEPLTFLDQYVRLRLRPVMAAQLIAYAISEEAEADRHARQLWLELQTQQEIRRGLKDLTRLCGTWQWIVHNHQNHADHKLMMVFPSPTDPAPAAARPAKMAVLGDSVYLRWEFQGGYQEDSLLFTGEGHRLEGSFTNSAGAWGSITGKRVRACGK